MTSPTDPLSFFAQDTSSSESEDEESKKPAVVEDSSESESEFTSTGQRKLTAPDKLFADVNKPDFLNTPQYLDWDKYTKNLPEDNIHETENYAAIPPPKEGIMLTSGETITGQAVKYSDPETDKTRDLGSTKILDVNASIELGMKRTQATEDDSSAKKAKVETFREKERRKRNMGMQSRGKSYVEEEKRILRQQFSTDQQLN
ncbi:UPF0690 protein C1orf52 homolog [Dysidea avara]|uniref:UPF0690 protein C1orf52 homolog n=1 Tax=Dysidea avara TaxID=196820 RepID=UPI00331CEFD4